MRSNLALSVFALSFTFGCSTESLIETASGGKVKIDESGKQVTIQTDKGAVNIQGEEGRAVFTGPGGEKMTVTDGKEIPKDFPLPIIDGGVVTTAAEMKEDTGVMYNLGLETDKQPSEVADFYSKALSDKGLKVNRNDMKTDDGTAVILNAQDGATKVMVQAGRKGTDAKTIVVLHYVK